jgi:RHS repeat-associated protein
MGGIAMRRLRRLLVSVAGFVLAFSSVTAVAPAASAAERVPKIWSPSALPAAKSVPGHPLARGAHHLTVQEPAGVAAGSYRVHAAWPAAGRGTASLASLAQALWPRVSAPLGVVTPVTGQAGTLPVWVSGEPASGTAADITVAMAAHGSATAAGVNGVLLSLAGRGAGTVSVRLNYSAFAGEFGGGWASRLRLVEMPACALTTPAVAACRKRTPVASVNNVSAQNVTASVRLAPAATASPTATVLAATSTSAGAEGNYAATSLKPSATWAVQQGDFSYSYPITVPPAMGGSVPGVTLSYNSQSIDGETSGTNTQASWVGDGWDYSPGYMERTYKPCSKDGISGSDDECWGGYNAILSLAGHSSVVVRDDSSGTWHLHSDDGTKVEELHGANNGVWNGEYWLVTTTDGTKYYFGQNHLPGGSGSDAATNSAWGVPVYNPSSGNPCYSSTAGASSECQMGYRWNLDYVVDPHGNLTTYVYATEGNYYERGGGQNSGKGTLTQYVRGGYPTTISYGYRLPDAIAGASPAAKVLFGTSQRCLTTSTFTNCSYSNLSSSTASNWPDVPYDQNCASSGTCTVNGPTFWSTVRLTSITTQVLSGSAYANVDSYALTHSFPNASGASSPVMFLNSITHTGQDGTAIKLLAVTFTPTEIDNRVDGLVPAAPPLYRPRISVVTTEDGASTAVTYAAPACSRVNSTMPASADTNTLPCFPVYWTPPGEAAPIQDWFSKSLVTTVSTADETGIGSPVQTTSYQYAGGAAWHKDESPLTDPAYRTWDQYRGYAKVITETGVSPDPVTETETTYMRGMNGDATASGGTKSVSVTDSLGDSVTDVDWLASQVLETDTYTKAGGSVDQKAVNGPWTFRMTASQAMPSGVATLTGEMPQAGETRSLSLLASGSWRDEQTDIAYNTAAQVITSDHKGDGSASDRESCTTTSYAAFTANPMMGSYPGEVKVVTGTCGTTATATNTVADTRTSYDAAGDATGTEVISGYDSSGNPVFQSKSAGTYDAYGRTLTSTDAKGNVTTTAYTPATGALPTQTAVTNPKGWTTTTLLDQVRQLPVQVTDVNGRVTSETYDALGRVTQVWLPIRSKASGQSPTYTYAYAVTGTSPDAVTTSTLRENGSYSADIKVYDGLLQLRQEQTSTADGSGGRLVTDTFHDSHGWVVKTSAPYYDSTTTAGTTVFAAVDGQVPSQTVTQYDGQGRKTASQFYSLGSFQWQTTTAYPGTDRTDVTPPSGGTATSTFTNGLGEKTATWSYTTASPTGTASDADVTSYTYDPAGKTASITDNSGNKWTYTYDLLGQKVSQTDPDAGTTSYTYDANGNMLSSTDARGQTLVYAYDTLNRKTAETALTSTGGSVSAANELASWTYDTLAKGQLTSSTSYAAGSAYTEAVTGYTTDYKPTGTSMTIPAAEGALAGTYTTTNTYWPNTGLLLSTAFSADGGLPAETARYAYDLQGLLTAVNGTSPYLDLTQYTPLGQVQRTTTGPAGLQLVSTESYDQATGRLLQTTTNLQNLSSAADVTNYTYNQSGAITSVSDTQDTGQTDLQCFGYDNLDRLTQAWTDTGGIATTAGPSVPGIGGCTTTTPSLSTVGGPAPYWQTYTYNLLGDRTSEVQHEASGNVTQTLSYPATHPNSVSSVTATGTSGTTTLGYQYDAAGDATSRSGSSALNLSYDPQGRVSTVTTNGGTSSYLYDADGGLLVQRDPSGTTLYLDGGAEQLVLSGAAVTGRRFYTEPGGTTIVRSGASAVSYTIANQQNTAGETVAASALALTRRYYDPYGNLRGATPSSWPDNLGFVGKPADPNTSLDLLGAREYDAVTGRFLQIDPVLEAGDSRQMGGYSYAADNPVNQSDPTGAMPAPEGGDGGGGCGAAGCDTGTGSTQCWGPGGEWLCGDSGGNNGSAGPPNLPTLSTTTTSTTSDSGSGNDGCIGIHGECGHTYHPDSGGGGFSIVHVFKKALVFVGNVTGITDAINCIKNPTVKGCLTAAVKLGGTAFTIATGGLGSGEAVSADALVESANAGARIADTAMANGAAGTGADVAVTSGESVAVKVTTQAEIEPATYGSTLIKSGLRKAACAVIALCSASGMLNTDEMVHGLDHVDPAEIVQVIEGDSKGNVWYRFGNSPWQVR